MNRTLRALVPVLALASAVSSLKADITMRLTGRITTKNGTPVAGAKITIRKIDTGWHREILTDENGIYSQAGLAPDKDKQYELTIKKEGFLTSIHQIPVPLIGSSLTRDFILIQPGEEPPEGAETEAPTTQVVDPSMKQDADARVAFNTAIPMYNNKQYIEALPYLGKAYTGISNAIATMKDETAKADSESLLPTISKAYGLALFQIGKHDEAIALLSKLVDSDPKNTKNVDAMVALVQMYTKKKDDLNRSKYQLILNAATGTSNASEIYNSGVNAFNANHFKEAKQYLLKAVEADASFPDSHYLLGLIELNQGNMGGAKAQFQKYIELAPNGSHAEEVRGMLSSF